MNIESIRMSTDEKDDIIVCKIQNGKAYDQDGDEIPQENFKAFPSILSLNFIREEKEPASCN